MMTANLARFVGLVCLAYLFSLVLTGCSADKAAVPLATYVTPSVPAPKAPPECDPKADPAFPRLAEDRDSDEDAAIEDRKAVKRHARSIAGRRLVCYRWLEKTLQEPAKSPAASS